MRIAGAVHAGNIGGVAIRDGDVAAVIERDSELIDQRGRDRSGEAEGEDQGIDVLRVEAARFKPDGKKRQGDAVTGVGWGVC